MSGQNSGNRRSGGRGNPRGTAGGGGRRNPFPNANQVGRGLSTADTDQVQRMIGSFGTMSRRLQAYVMPILRRMAEWDAPAQNPAPAAAPAPAAPPARAMPRIRIWDRPILRDLQCAEFLRGSTPAQRSEAEGQAHNRTLSAASAALNRGQLQGISDDDIRASLLANQDSVVNLSSLWVQKTSDPGATGAQDHASSSSSSGSSQQRGGDPSAGTAAAAGVEGASMEIADTGDDQESKSSNSANDSGGVGTSTMIPLTRPYGEISNANSEDPKGPDGRTRKSARGSG